MEKNDFGYGINYKIAAPRILIKNVALSVSMPRGKKKGISTKKFDRCVSKVRSKSGKKANPYAVCNASMGGKSKSRKK